MIEPEDQDRWSALAEELGLPPSTAHEPVPGVSEAQGNAVTEPVQAPEPPSPTLPSLNLGEGKVEEVPVRGRRRRGTPATEEKPEGPGEVAPTGEGTTETPAEEERPRRRRRLRGSKKLRKSERAETTEPAAETEEASEEDRSRRRRRRRSKRADKESEATTSADMEEASVEQMRIEEPILDEEEDEEAEDFSTWNVPTWAEIIAGLYRPER